MSSAAHTLRERIARRDAFSRDEIAAMMSVEDDLDLWSAVYQTLDDSYYHIDPEPSMEITCSFMLSYLLRCIRENPPSDHTFSGYEAAHELAARLKFWALKLPQTEPVLRLAEQRIAAAYICGNDDIKDRLLNGALEHALESAHVRPFFAHWADDAALAEAWRLGMEWAVSRGDPAK